MVKSVNMQLRSKDTDIQRLNIKILRVEKAKEIVDDVLKENLKNAIESQSVINSIASPMSKPPTSAKEETQKNTLLPPLLSKSQISLSNGRPIEQNYETFDAKNVMMRESKDNLFPILDISKRATSIVAMNKPYTATRT